jgi:hypothetical protein
MKDNVYVVVSRHNVVWGGAGMSLDRARQLAEDLTANPSLDVGPFVVVQLVPVEGT